MKPSMPAASLMSTLSEFKKASEEKPVEAVGSAHMWCALVSPELGEGGERAMEVSADAGMALVLVVGSACCSIQCIVSLSLRQK
jgi:hypothetical protein